MRIIAILFLGLSLAAYLAQPTKPVPANPATCSPEPSCQAEKLLFQSTDGGDTWRDLSRLMPENHEIAVVFADQESFYLTTRDGYLYQSANACEQACKPVDLGGLFPESVGESAVNRITGIFKGASGPYFSVAFAGLFQKNKEANQWLPINKAKHHDNAHSVLETADGAIIVGHEGGIYKTTDKGLCWKRVSAAGAGGHLAALGNTLLASGQRGLLRSTDGGEHWECILADEGNGLVNNIRVVEGGAVLARIANKLAPFSSESAATFSLDGGKTWEFVDAGYPSATIFDLARSGKYLYCSHSRGISRSEDGGKTWALVQAWEVRSDRKRIELSVCGPNIVAALVEASC